METARLRSPSSARAHSRALSAPFTYVQRFFPLKHDTNPLLQALVDGGTLLQVGCGKPDVELPLMAMAFREVR